MWEVRKALYFIRDALDKEGYDTELIPYLIGIVDGIDRDDTEQYILRIDEFNTALARLVIELWSDKQGEDDLMDGVFTQQKYTRNAGLLTVRHLINNWLYFSGLGPKPVFKPVRKKKQHRTDMWRTEMACPVCGKSFKVLQRWDRQEALTEYSKWLFKHSKSECQGKFIMKRSSKS